MSVRRGKAGIGLALLVITFGVGAETVRSQSVAPGLMGPRRSDPPGFGGVTVDPGQTIRLHVACYPHRIGQFPPDPYRDRFPPDPYRNRFPPDPCRGTFMFHDASGMEVKRGSYNLKPGELATLEFAVADPPGELDPRSDRVGGMPVFLLPCVEPAPGGRAVPSVEVIDRATGHVALFANPAAARMSDFSNGRGNPGGRVGFNPQPDPPGFGAVTVSSDQVVRMDVACFAHSVNGFPPDPCKGSVMFHDAAGTALTNEKYSLMPGETAMFEFAPMGGEARSHVTVIPCVAPAPGGRVVPIVSLANAMTGKTSLLIPPAAPAMSDFQ